jgi:hypothetical protein
MHGEATTAPARCLTLRVIQRTARISRPIHKFGFFQNSFALIDQRSFREQIISTEMIEAALAILPPSGGPILSRITRGGRVAASFTVRNISARQSEEAAGATIPAA